MLSTMFKAGFVIVGEKIRIHWKAPHTKHR